MDIVQTNRLLRLNRIQKRTGLFDSARARDRLGVQINADELVRMRVLEVSGHEKALVQQSGVAGA